MPKNLSLSVHHFPTPAILCEQDGAILDANEKATYLLSHQLVGHSLDTLIDFSRSDLSGCESFKQATDILKSRSKDHNIISLPYNKHPVSHINLHFSFFKGKQQDLVLIGLLDVSERIKLLEAFEYKQNLLDNILTTSSDALIVFDSQGYIELFSPAAESMFGKTSTEMIIEDIYCLFEEKSHEKLKSIFEHFTHSLDSKEVLVFEDIIPIKSNGETFPASTTFSKSQKDSDSLYFLVVSDKSLFHKFVNSVNDAYIKTDQEGLILDVNKKAESMFHYERDMLLKKHISFLEIKNDATETIVTDVSQLIDKASGEEDYTSTNRRGNRLSLNLTVWPQEVNNVRLNNLIIRDISQKKLAEQQLISSAYTDTLTGLSNRANFNKVLQELIETKTVSKHEFALLCIDLDKFKNVNDTFGHDYGDELLKVASNRLSACVREQDIVSRMGGDEFTVLVTDIDSDNTLHRIADRILRTFRRDFSIKDKRINISTSIGIALFPKDATTGESLLKAADMAMYSAKRAGKDDYHFFTKDLQNEYERQKIIERALNSAIPNNEFTLFFQPKVSHREGRVIGFEALIRWQSEELGPISPMEFIPIAEDTGQIIEITKWVLQEGLGWIAKINKLYNRSGKAPVSLAINISPEHFKYQCIEDITRALEVSQLDPSLLELEITESILLENTDDVLDVLNAISDLGVQICLDDFGTGYSSLQYLKHFKLNTIKIDRSFVRDISVDQHNIFIVESIISIASRLKLNLVAEGVETSDELRRLVDLSCDIFQGFYFAKPLPANEAEVFLQDFSQTPKAIKPVN